MEGANCLVHQHDVLVAVHRCPERRQAPHYDQDQCNQCYDQHSVVTQAGPQWYGFIFAVGSELELIGGLNLELKLLNLVLLESVLPEEVSFFLSGFDSGLTLQSNHLEIVSEGGNFLREGNLAIII
jgi:hypothetical protein